MDKQKWWNKLKNNISPIRSIILDYHPIIRSDRLEQNFGRTLRDLPTDSTDIGDKLCHDILKKGEDRDALIELIKALIEKNPYKMCQLMNETFFALPKNDCRNIIGFTELCELLEDYYDREFN